MTEESVLFVVEENPVFLLIEHTHKADAEGRISRRRKREVQRIEFFCTHHNHNPSVPNLLVQDIPVLPSEAPR